MKSVLAAVAILVCASSAGVQRIAAAGVVSVHHSAGVTTSLTTPAAIERSTARRAAWTAVGALVGAVAGINVYFGAIYNDAATCSDCKPPARGAWPYVAAGIGAGVGGAALWWLSGVSSSVAHASAPAQAPGSGSSSDMLSAGSSRPRSCSR